MNNLKQVPYIWRISESGDWVKGGYIDLQSGSEMSNTQAHSPSLSFVFIIQNEAVTFRFRFRYVFLVGQFCAYEMTQRLI